MGVKISSLPAIVTPALTDIFPVVQGGVTYKESFTQLSSLFATSGANTNITSLAGLTTPLSIAQGGTGSATGDPTFDSVTFNPTTKGIVGTPTNNNAASSYVGEFISSIVLSGAALPMTTNTALDITTISLTAGDWNVWGTLWLAPAAGTITTTISVSVSQTSATLPTTPAIGTSIQQIRGLSSAAGEVCILQAPTTRISLAGTTTIYLVGFATFTTSTMGGYGSLCARRVR